MKSCSVGWRIDWLIDQRNELDMYDEFSSPGIEP
jgi:hypothetical protein